MHARVATFEGGDPGQLQETVADLKQRSNEGPPEGVPAKSFLMLHSADGSKVLSIMLFDTEEDLKQGDSTMNTMDPPGRRRDGPAVVGGDVRGRREGGPRELAARQGHSPVQPRWASSRATVATTASGWCASRRSVKRSGLRSERLASRMRSDSKLVRPPWVP